MVYKGQTSHIASNFSVIDIATVLYENLKEGDEVVWSAGWKAATIYYFLAQQGKIPKEDLDLFAKEIDGKVKYLGLAETTTPGVWVNGGSVGQGLPVAVGMALGKKLKGEKGIIYCILSDGELDEGTVWESVRIAARHKLDNLVAIIDQNGWQAMGRTDEVNGGDVFNSFVGHGWVTREVHGHNYADIGSAVSTLVGAISNRPTVLVAKTTKGKGVSFMENHLTYHYKHLDDETYQKALAELVDK